MPRGQKLTTELVKINLKNKWGELYDHSKVIYGKPDEYIIVICRIHGEFLITYHHHIRGRGCKQCGVIHVNKKNSDTFEKFLLKAIKKFGIKHIKKYFDYSTVKYKDSNTPIDITCKICKKIFNPTPKNHLHKDKRSKCTHCSRKERCAQNGKKSKGQEELEKYLDSINVEYDTEYTAPNFRDKLPLPIDARVAPGIIKQKDGKKREIWFEMDGGHHRNPVAIFGGIPRFIMVIKHDAMRYQYCDDNDIMLIRCSDQIRDIPSYIENIIKNSTMEDVKMHNKLLGLEQRVTLLEY